ncbi:MAG: DUF7064 domain-containing protein [Ilumatobacteraceae bacterium]
MSDSRIITVLEPDDEYPHEPDDSPNYNESMYLNAFDLERGIGGWFRLGNRVNEGYAEMTVCLYLPGGRVGFMYQRPKITTNTEMSAGGLRIEVVTPFEELRVTYSGRVVLLDEPEQMVDPRTAFRENPHVDCTVDLTVRGMSPMYGGKPVRADGSEIETDPTKSFAKAHYEQHTRVTGTITLTGEVADGSIAEVIEIDGFGLRDKSWGPRYWQAIGWYRWLPIMLGPDLAMMLSVIDAGPGQEPRQSGMVLSEGEYHKLVAVEIDSDFDDRGHQTAMRCRATTAAGAVYEIEGEVISLIPLRNRRTSPDGSELTTRITEAMTRYRCNGLTGVGMSEYLDQVLDGWPIGPDVPARPEEVTS